MQHTNDYFTILDLNPTINGAAVPIVDPRDKRALCMFGFKANRQRFILLPAAAPPAGNIRVCYSFDYDYFPGSTLMSLPSPGKVTVHGVMTIFGPALQDEVWLDHDRDHVLFWLDPTSQFPPMGTPVEVHVRASARE